MAITGLGKKRLSTAKDAGPLATVKTPPAVSTPKADGVEAARPAQAKPALDGQLQGAYAEFQKLLGVAVNTGRWTKLDGSKAPGTERQLLDVQGRFAALSMDPAKGKLSPGSVEEAAIGLAAERAGIVPPPISREATGQAEFVDGTGAFWDVKSPVSPWEGATWKFDAQHQVGKVLHDLSQDNSVLLNLARLTEGDAATLLGLLQGQLTPEQQERVVVLRTNEVYVRG